MNLIVPILVVIFIASPVYAEPKKKESGFQKAMRSMFPSATPKIVQPKRKRATRAKQKQEVRQTPEPPKPNRLYVPVEIDWMARYWEEEAAWDYYIPEDDQIRFVDGKYQVPIVVYRHYEDMAKTPRRTPSPKPVDAVM